MTDLVWIEHQHDRDAASDGVSRFGAYLRQNLDQFDKYQDREGFAVSAWYVATHEMTPGYVRFRPDLHGIDLDQDEYDHGLVATVHVPLLAPRSALSAAGPGAETWRRSTDRFTDTNIYEAPPRQAGRAALLPTIDVRVAVDAAALPEPPDMDDPAAHRHAAAEAVADVVRQILQTAGPIVAQLRNAE